MRTTLDLPEQLIQEAMELTHIKTKTELITTAIQQLIQREKMQELSTYYGKLNLDIDLNQMRDR